MTTLLCEPARTNESFYQRAGYYPAILWITAVCVASAVAFFSAARWAGSDMWVLEFFRVPAVMVTFWLAAVRLWLSWRVISRFEPGEPLRRAWVLITISAVCEAMASVVVQIFDVGSQFNVMGHAGGFWSDVTTVEWRQSISMFAGSCRFALLAGGLGYALGTYRRAGFLGRMAPIDRALLIMSGMFILRSVINAAFAVHTGNHARITESLNWPVDPLSWLLLAQAILLYRSVQRTGSGWVGNCWMAFSWGIILTCLGDIAMWAADCGYLGWPWISVSWYLWLPAACCFALAPAYQLQVTDRAVARTPGQ